MLTYPIVPFKGFRSLAELSEAHYTTFSADKYIDCPCVHSPVFKSVKWFIYWWREL